MATLTKTVPVLAGVVPTAAAASAGGDQVANPKGKTYLRVINGGGSSINVTVAAQSTTRPSDGTFPSMTLSSQVVAVANGTTKVIGPIPPAFVDGNGNTQITYSAVTSVTVEAFDAE
jgi:hypothetical protein